MTPHTPWKIWRRVSGETSRVVATVKARSAKEALTSYARAHGYSTGDEFLEHRCDMAQRPLEYVATPQSCICCGQEPAPPEQNLCTHCGRPRDVCRRETWERVQCKVEDDPPWSNPAEHVNTRNPSDHER